MDDDLTSTLAEAKRIADSLQFACRIPDKTPDFTACGGPAAEAYWAYFTPARVSSLIAAIEAPLKLTRDSAGNDRHRERVLTVGEVRDAITAELTGNPAGDEPRTRPSSSMQNPAGVVRVLGEEAGDGI